MRKKLVSSSHYLQETKKKKRVVFKKRIFVFVALFVIVFSILGALSRWSKLNIKEIEVSGNTVIDSTAVQDLVQNEINGRYLWVFPKANFLLYPKAEIEKDLQNEFKIIKNLSVKLSGINKLSVNFDEREGKYTWCGNDTISVVDESQCYFMDETGYIFGEAPYFSGDVFLKFYGEVSKDSPSPMGYLFFPELFGKLLVFRDSTQSMGVKVSAFFVKPDGDVELYLSSNTPMANKPKVIFEANADMEKISENLQTALSTEPLLTNFKKNFSKLVHIDLRYGNKVYYKFTE